jgi:pimeloyl-ACP methyl ester carboxylesterase
LLTDPDWQRANRASFLKDEPYAALDPASGTARLLAAGIEADWDVPWERLEVPALVLSGLQDRVFFDAADVAALSARLSQVERIDLPDVGHLVSMERAQAVVDACLALARKIP